MPIYTKSGINSERLKQEIITAIGVTPSNMSWTAPDDLVIEFTPDISALQLIVLNLTVESHLATLPAEALAAYLNNSVYPFTQALIMKFAAENIANGITQSGKTGHTLSLFSRFYPVPSEEFPNSLKNCFDTGSLYLAINVLDYLIINPAYYTDLSPFITITRLTELKTSIQRFLGII